MKFSDPLTDVLFNWFYPYLCDEQDVPMGLQTDDAHKIKLHQNLPDLPPFRKLDTRMKLGRWYSFHDKHMSWKKHRMAVLMIHIYMGLQRKWWKSFEECPLFDLCVADLGMLDDNDEEYIPAGVVADEDAEDVPEVARGSKDPVPEPKRRMTVGESNDCLRKVRGQHKNTMHFSTTAFARFTQLRCIDVCTGLQDEIVTVFKLRLSESKTRRGMRTMYIDFADGLWSKTISKVWAKLSDPEFARGLGYSASAEQSPKKIAANKEVVRVAFDMTMSLSEKFLL